MSALIERLEQATESDREMDAQIYCDKNGYGFIKFERWNQHAGRLFYTIPGMVPHCESEGFPLYTTSIDAALTLVPDFINRRWYVADSDDRSNGRPVATVYHPANILKGLIPRNEGATPAIALCIAALKARKAQP